MQFWSCSSNTSPRVGDGHCDYRYLFLTKASILNIFSVVFVKLMMTIMCTIFVPDHGTSKWLCRGLYRGIYKAVAFFPLLCSMR